MRIVSLLPSATEIVYALGLQDSLVGITHECDFPPEAKSKPVLIETALGPDYEKMAPGEIDTRIREILRRGEGVYRFKPGALEQAQPDLVITQGICDVCAVPYQFVMSEVKKLPRVPEIISLDPTDLAGILVDIRRVGEITGAVDRAGEVVDALEERIGEVAGCTRDLPAEKRPRVGIIEWTEPLFAAGHWAPEMVELAGGRDVLAPPGEPSQTITWEKLVEAAPEVLIVAPCGYELDRAKEELKVLTKHPDWPKIPAVQSKKVFVIDACSTLSRPGPRIVDGLELLAQIIQPEIFTGKNSSAIFSL